MNLYDEILQASKPNRPQCSVGKVVAELDDADRTALTTALADPAVTGAGIAKVLTARGHKLNGPTVQRHRRGDCDCD